MKSRSRIGRAAAIAIAAAAVAVLAFLFYTSRPLRVLAYGLSDKEVSSLGTALAKAGTAAGALRAGVSFRAEAAEKALPSPAALARKPRAGLVLLRPDAALAARAGELLEPIPAAIRDRVSPRIAESGGDPERILPLLVDEFGASFDEARFRKAGLAPPASLADIEASLPILVRGGAIPIVAAGAEDYALLGLVSALLVADSGAEGYRAAAKAASDGELGALGPVLDRLAAWTDGGILHPNWLDLRDRDLAVMVRNRLAPGFFAFLGERRLMDAAALEPYPMGAFPEGRAGAGRPVVTPIIAAILPKGSGRRAAALLDALSAPDALAALSAASGLAPAASAAPAADLQARRARQDAIELGAVAGLAFDAAAGGPDGGAASLARRIREEIGKRR